MNLSGSVPQQIASRHVRVGRFRLVGAILSMLAISGLRVLGIDPDIQKALNHAPPPADFMDPSPFPRILPNIPQEESYTTLRKDEALAKLRNLQLWKTDWTNDPTLTIADWRVLQSGWARAAQLIPARPAFDWLVAPSLDLDPKYEGITLTYEMQVLTGLAGVKPLERRVDRALGDASLGDALAEVCAQLKLTSGVEKSGKSVVAIDPPDPRVPDYFLPVPPALSDIFRTPVSGTFHSAPASHVVLMLCTGLDINLTSALDYAKPIPTPFTGTFKNMPLRTALYQLARATHITIELVDRGDGSRAISVHN